MTFKLIHIYVINSNINANAYHNKMMTDSKLVTILYTLRDKLCPGYV